jgi:hypothetical protein
LRLVHRPTGRVVTVLELLFPTNKTLARDGLEACLEKRAEVLASRCHLVELDLLGVASGGRWPGRCLRATTTHTSAEPGADREATDEKWVRQMLQPLQTSQDGTPSKLP